MKSNKLIFYILFPFIVLSSSNIFSQEENNETEQAIENMAASDEDLIKKINENRLIMEHGKYNINSINESELFSIQILTPIQISQFLLYRKTIGSFINILELQAVPYWDLETIQKATNYLRVANKEHIIPEIKQRLQEGKHTLLYRTGGTTYGIKKGTSTIYGSSSDIEKGYKQLIKYSFEFRNLIKWGLIIEKDAGEKNFADHLSGYGMIKKSGILNTLILGDYLVNLGQGLIHWQGHAFGKSNNIIGGYRQEDVIRVHTGSDENRYHRGFATTLKLKKTSITLFLGLEKIDANIVYDSTMATTKNKYISSFLTSGLHIKKSELEDKNAVTEIVYGGRIHSEFSKLKIGINYINTRFDYPIKKRYQPYNYFSIKGNEWHNASFDFSTNTKYLFLFGEGAIDKNIHKAAVAGLIKSLDQKLDVTLIYRNISKDFRSLQSNAFTQNTDANNEKGLFICMNFQTNTKSKIDAYADHYINPWPGYFADGTRRGSTYSLQYTWKPNKKTELYIRSQKDERNINERPAGNKINNLAVAENIKWRIHFSYMPDAAFTIRQRVELSTYKKERLANEKGFLSYVEVIYKPMLKPFTLSARVCIFDTEGYNARIYTYERDIQSYYSIPAFYDKGIRHYVLMQYKITRKIEIWMKWISNKSAANGVVYGPSSFGNILKKEWRIQMLWHF